MNTEDIKRQFEKDFQDAKSQIGHPNILLIGKTGVGKSTLVNTIFGKKLAEISHTKPQTRGFQLYSSPDLFVNIIDSEGYELNREEYFLTQLKEYIASHHQNLKEQVHICWYALSVASGRVLEFDLEVIKLLRQSHIPIAVVFTQCDLDDVEGTSSKAMSNVIYSRFKADVPCYETSNDAELNKELDVEKLIIWSANNISEENLRAGFIAAQCADLSLKKESADKVIRRYVGLAASTAVSPIPMSDSIILTGLQMKMASDIYTKYGLSSSISDVIQHVIKNKLISMVGKMVAGNLLKFIPIIGPWIGGGINALVASSITYGLGQTISYMCRQAIESAWKGQSFTPLSDNTIKDMIDKFTKEYKNSH